MRTGSRTRARVGLTGRRAGGEFACQRLVRVSVGRARSQHLPERARIQDGQGGLAVDGEEVLITRDQDVGQAGDGSGENPSTGIVPGTRPPP